MTRHLVTTRKDLGDSNRRQVLAELMFNGPLARAEIAKRVHLTQASVSRITKELIENDLIFEERSVTTHRVGRPLVQLNVNPSGGYVIGVAINLFKQIVTIADLANETLASCTLQPADITNPEQVLEDVVLAAHNLLDDLGLKKEEILSCGVAITGAVDPSTGVSRSAPSLGWSDHVHVGPYLEEKLKLPVYVDTVPNAKNLAEYGYGKTRQNDNVVLLNVYHIIGASFLLNGELYRGHNFHAGVIENAPLVTAFAQGPAKELVSGRAVLKAYYGDAALPSQLTAAKSVFDLIDKANNGEQKAMTAFLHAGIAMAQLIKVVKEILQPEMILLTGPVLDCECYVNQIRSELERYAGEHWLERHFKISRISSEFAAQSLALYKSISEPNLLLAEHPIAV